MPDARDAIEKLNRADKHLKDLQARIGAFLKSGAYQAVPYFDPQQPGIPVMGRVLSEPPVYEWGPIIGDIVHNTRSALDNVTWALSVHFSPVPPPDPLPSGDPWRRVQFPIVLDGTNWRGREGLDRLWAVPALHAEFQRLQPFHTGPNDPSREPLAVLQELWNRDKHRHIHLAQCFVSLQDALSISEEEFRKPKRWTRYGVGGFCPDCPGPPQHNHPLHNIIEDVVRAEPGRIRYEVVEAIPVGPFKDGAILGIVAPVLTPGDWGVGAPHMDVNPVLAFDVAFEQGPPTYGGRLVETLQTLLDAATAIVVQFEPHLT